MRSIISNRPMLAVHSSFNLSATAHPIFSEDDKAAEIDPCLMLSSIGADLDSPTDVLTKFFRNLTLCLTSLVSLSVSAFLFFKTHIRVLLSCRELKFCLEVICTMY